MTQGINEANALYNEKLTSFNKQILLKNNKLLEYKNKISVLKVKINELYDELNTLKGTNSVNNNSFFNTSFINNSIINTNNNINKTKIITNLNAYTYSSKTVDRKDIKDNMSFNKMTSMINLNNSKDDIINKDKNIIKNDIIVPQIKKEILIPQTPQITKEAFIPKLSEEEITENKAQNKIQNKPEIKNNKQSDIQEFINKNKEEDKNRINFLKEYKEILDKYDLNQNQSVKKDN